ncbi:hypothetical protein [Inquilinus sp.]|uniref:hypothetical protein n=1 Tax=Inquilinus sp. TaxID=1932117 RepID=UPI003784301E
MTPRDVEDPPEEHSLGKGGGVSSGAGCFEHVGDALARALDSIARGIDPTLQQIEAAAMSEIAKIMGWPLDAAAWGPVTAAPEGQDPPGPIEPARPAGDLNARLAAIEEAVPPTDPVSVRIYEIAAGLGPAAAKEAIGEAMESGEITRVHADALLWCLALDRG